LVVPLDSERRWYRYHHLFTDLLRQRLRQTRPDWAYKLHRQASKWYEGNGFAGEAIEHALRAEDFERASDMIEGLVEHVLHFGEQAKLRRWLAEIPFEVAFSKPYICILHAGNSYISGQIEEAERYLQRAGQALELVPAAGSDAGLMSTDRRPGRDKLKLRGRMATMRSYLVAYHGDEEASIQYARQALKLLPKSDFTWRSSAFDSLGTAYNATDVVAAYRARTEAMEASKAAGNAYMILFASLRLVVTLRDLGRLGQAVEICRQQLKVANDNGLSQTALVGWLFTLWGEILAEKNELDNALQLVNKGVALTGRGNDVTLLGSSYLCLMRVLFSKGELDQATETIQRVNDFAPKRLLSPWIMDQMAAWQARIWLAQDKLDSAAGWAEELGPDGDEALEPMHDYAYGVLARILIAQGRLDEAGRLLQRLFEAAESGSRTAKMLEIMALQSLAYQAQGEPDRALDVLERALTLAEPEGFIRLFMDEGRPMARLLHRALNCGIAPEYVRRLLAGESTKEPGSAEPLKVQSGMVEPLSEREIEVLQYIAVGLTNREIADRLYLALNTVKVHTRNIYGKLDVNSRMQAVARARDLEILPRS
jgi:LuxR family maltose regulon positive regulatory protein